MTATASAQRNLWRHFDRWFRLTVERCWRCRIMGWRIHWEHHLGGWLDRRWLGGWSYGYCAKHWEDAWTLAGRCVDREWTH